MKFPVRLLSAAVASIAGSAAVAAAPADFSTYTPRLDAVRIERSEAPTIDGDLSDPAWAKAATTEDFYQVEPREGAPASLRTRAHVMYDEKNLYFAFYLFDPDLSKRNARLLERDADLHSEDAIRILIDSFDTYRDGFFFATNANAARTDALIENSDAFRGEWDAIWTVRTKDVADGWIAEIEIPFQSISLDESLDEWGLQFIRTIPRTNEEVRWSNIDRSRDRIDLTNPGRLAGVRGVEQGIGIEAQLYATGATSYDWETGETRFRFDPSANIFYKITPALTGSLTFNTDFSDAPLDQRQVNTGRFSLFFPETRDFFLQDAASFEFGGAIFGDEANGLPFFSRNIGIVDDQPVDIIAGAKLSGKAGAANLGALIVKTGSGAGAEGQYLGSARASFSVLSESKIGAVLTYGDPTGLYNNALAGVDFQYKNSRRYEGTLSADFAYLRTIDEDPANGASSGQMAAIAASYSSERWNWETNLAHIDEDYAPRLGFANRTGIRNYGFRGWREWRTGGDFLRVAETGLRIEAVTDLGDEVLDREMGAWAGVVTQSEDEIFISASREFTDIREAFDIADILNVPIGEYRITRYGVEGRTSQARPILVRAEFDWGGAYGGKFRELEAGFRVSPNKHLRFSGDYELTQFRLPAGDLDIHVGTLAATIAFSPTLFIRSDVQYDNISESFSLLSRLTWEPRPDTEIILSVGHAAIIEGDRFPQSFRAQGTSVSLRLGRAIRR